ncbi:MAG: M23 family metallopeptidase, partial [Bacteroidota bacterium]
FNGARVEAKLNNIMVNTDKQLIGGNVESIYNPNGPFILDMDSDEELSEEGTGEQEEGEEDSFDELPEPDINIEGEIEDVITDEEDGTITVIDSEGNETDIDPETADENEDGDIVIEDEEGNTYIVDEGGNVSGPHNSNPSDPDVLPQDSEIDYLVEFKSHPDQLYGFDFKQYETLAGSYEQTQLNGEEYWLAWKSLKKGTTDAVMARETGGDEFPEAIRFKNMSGNLGTGPGSADNEKQVIVQTALEEEEIIAYVLQESTNEEGETVEEEVPVGKLKVKEYEPIRKNVVLVPVNDANVPEPSTLQDKLNSIYGPAVAEWEVSAAEPYEVSEEDLETLNEGESGIFASFPKDMRKFNRQFKRSVDFDKDAYYLFVIEGGYSDKAGIMPFKRQFGYIFKNNVDNINKTIAHELAHGAFRLRHTFSEEGFIASQNSTDNLMDYRPDGTDLYKHQWDLVHDLESMIGWFEDDEESEYSVETNSEKVIEILNKIREANTNEDVSTTMDLTNYGLSKVIKGNVRIGEDALKLNIILEGREAKNIIYTGEAFPEYTDYGFGENGEYLMLKFKKKDVFDITTKLLIDEENEDIVRDYLGIPIAPKPGDPLVDMYIVHSNPARTSGGTFGCVRSIVNNCEDIDIPNLPSLSGKIKVHDGFDLGAPLDTELFAMFDGEVIFVENSIPANTEGTGSNLGNRILIKSTSEDHGKNDNTMYAFYGHLNSVDSNITTGTTVSQGQKIGTTGRTGNAVNIDTDRYHLHLIVYENGTKQINKVNPNNYLETDFNINGHEQH